MSNSLTINTPNIVQQNTPLRNVPSGSTATSDYSVKFVPQDLTEAQQAQARQNIGAISESEIPASAQANWNETDTESPAYIQNKPTIPAAPVQSNWNESDTASLAYIQNKPTIPAAQVQADWNQSDNTAVDYIKNKPNISGNPVEINGYKYYTEIYVKTYASFNDNSFSLTPTYLIRNGKVVCNWNDLTDKMLDKYQKNTLIWDQENQDLYNGQQFLLDNMNNEITVVKPNYEYWVKTLPGSNTYNLTNTKLTYIISGNVGGSYIRPHGFDMRMGVPPQNMTTYFLNNTFSSGKYWGSYYVGNLVFVDKDFATPSSEAICSTLQADFTDVVNCYVPKTRIAEFTSLMETLYPDLDISSITSKIVGYDYLTWIDDHTPRVIILPTLPLTMTDENSTVISGDFVAQNLTITPAV